MQNIVLHRGKLIVIFLLLLTIQGAKAYQNEIDAIATKVAQDLATAQKKFIAVVDFSDLRGNPTELGRFLAEELSTALLNRQQHFQLVDRIHLNKLLQEQKLYATDLVEPSNAKKIGQIAGVDALITGTITPFGDSIRLSVKILDVTTAKIIGATAENIPKTKTIDELLPALTDTDTSSKSTQQHSPDTSPGVEQSTVACGCKIVLQNCERIGSGIICHFVITSIGQDKILSIIGYCPNSSNLYDNLGNEYKAEHVQIADKEGTCSVAASLIQDVPVKAIVTFGGITTEAKKITLLKLSVFSEGEGRVPEFRNVTLK